MEELVLSVGEPFTSPAFNANFVVFSNEQGHVVAAEDTEEYLRKACRYAKHYGVYLVPERFAMMGYHCLCLVSPQGTVLGAQKNLFLGAVPRGAAKRSTALDIWATPFGSIFLCVDVDIYRPQVAKLACNMGGQIVVSVQQFARGDYNGSMVVTGAWNATQQNNMYAISVSNEFNAVSAPIALTSRQDGFIVPPNLKLPMTARLHVDSLRELPRRVPLSRKLYAVHSKELSG